MQFDINAFYPSLHRWFLGISLNVEKTRSLIGSPNNYESGSRSVVSNSLRPHGLYSPWNSPGQNTGVGSLSLLQGISPTQKLNRISSIAGFFTSWATREAPSNERSCIIWYFFFSLLIWWITSIAFKCWSSLICLENLPLGLGVYFQCFWVLLFAWFL